MSSGTPDDAFAKEREELFDEAEQNGIMVLGGFYKHTMRNNSFDIRYGFVGRGLGIPTDGKTNPYFDGGYAYERLGGASSTFPYLAGVTTPLSTLSSILRGSSKKYPVLPKRYNKSAKSTDFRHEPIECRAVIFPFI